jgi:hypothetical protein
MKTVNYVFIHKYLCIYHLLRQNNILSARVLELYYTGINLIKSTTSVLDKYLVVSAKNTPVVRTLIVFLLIFYYFFINNKNNKT